MNASEITVTREGRVTLKASAAPPRYESFPVREYSDGAICYFLGFELARTSDGWVTLMPSQADRVVWNR